jgi:hypothetical protein
LAQPIGTISALAAGNTRLGSARARRDRDLALCARAWQRRLEAQVHFHQLRELLIDQLETGSDWFQETQTAIRRATDGQLG